MATAQDLITAVRYTIGDVHAEKWKNERLLILLNESCAEIAKITQALKGVSELLLVKDETALKLPTDCYFMTRAVPQGGKPLAIKSHYEMDAQVPGWEYTPSSIEVTAVIYDMLNRLDLLVYPPISEEALAYKGSTYGVPMPAATVNNSYGAPQEVNYSGSDYRFLAVRFSEDGAITDWFANFITLIANYVRLPAVYGLEDEVELDVIYHTAIKNYIGGMALSDDDRRDNDTKANLLLSAYGAYIKNLKETASLGFHRARPLEVDYRGGF